MNIEDAKTLYAEKKKEGLSCETRFLLKQIQNAIDLDQDMLSLPFNAMIMTKEALSALKKLGYDVENEKNKVIHISGWTS